MTILRALINALAAAAAFMTEEHAVWAGYDGEGVYAWSCTCGKGASDFTGLDDATLTGTEHLLDVDAVPACAGPTP